MMFPTYTRKEHNIIIHSPSWLQMVALPSARAFLCVVFAKFYHIIALKRIIILHRITSLLCHRTTSVDRILNTALNGSQIFSESVEFTTHVGAAYGCSADILDTASVYMQDDYTARANDIILRVHIG